MDLITQWGRTESCIPVVQSGLSVCKLFRKLNSLEGSSRKIFILGILWPFWQRKISVLSAEVVHLHILFNFYQTHMQNKLLCTIQREFLLPGKSLILSRPGSWLNCLSEYFCSEMRVVYKVVCYPPEISWLTTGKSWDASYENFPPWEKIPFLDVLNREECVHSEFVLAMLGLWTRQISQFSNLWMLLWL